MIFLFLFALTNSISFGQTTTTTDELLAGTWYLDRPKEDIIECKRVSYAPNNWGDRIEFNPENRFVDAYSGKCGNDSGTHRDMGTWKLSTMTIVTSIPISVDQGTKHEIIFISTDKLVLKKVK
jgi:hypothetical protein